MLRDRILVQQKPLQSLSLVNLLCLPNRQCKTHPGLAVLRPSKSRDQKPNSGKGALRDERLVSQQIRSAILHSVPEKLDTLRVLLLCLLADEANTQSSIRQITFK